MNSLKTRWVVSHSICGQLSNVVPVNTVQLSPAFAKLTTGLTISVRKLMVII